MNGRLELRVRKLEEVKKADRDGKAAFPNWLIREWREHGVRIDDRGMIDWSSVGNMRVHDAAEEGR